MAHEQLRTLAQMLVRTIQGSKTIDWTEKESVRAKMRIEVRKLLARYGYALLQASDLRSFRGLLAIHYRTERIRPRFCVRPFANTLRRSRNLTPDMGLPEFDACTALVKDALGIQRLSDAAFEQALRL